MYRKNVEELIPLVMKHMTEMFYDENHNIKKKFKSNKTNKIKKEYNGYFSSFGPSVITAGLKQTVLFYADKDLSNDKKHVVDLLEKVLKEKKWLESTLEGEVNNKKYNPLLKDRVLEIISASKLCIRTLDLED